MMEDSKGMWACKVGVEFWENESPVMGGGGVRDLHLSSRTNKIHPSQAE